MVMEAVEEIEYEGLSPNAGLGVSLFFLSSLGVLFGILMMTYFLPFFLLGLVKRVLCCWGFVYSCLWVVMPGQHDGWGFGEFFMSVDPDFPIRHRTYELSVVPKAHPKRALTHNAFRGVILPPVQSCLRWNLVGILEGRSYLYLGC